MSNSEASPQHPRCEKCSDLILELEAADKRGDRRHGDVVYDVLLGSVSDASVAGGSRCDEQRYHCNDPHSQRR